MGLFLDRDGDHPGADTADDGLVGIHRDVWCFTAICCKALEARARCVHNCQG